METHLYNDSDASISIAYIESATTRNMKVKQDTNFAI